ncbi:MAG: hypothetical protein IT266_03770 [Saprospiraceae bacterium]|nr:hypothetical protein [Saprospiraceae bacterium]
MNLWLVLMAGLLVSCGQQADEGVQGQWLRGTQKEKLEMIERQLRGFDVAMVEIGYRYQELYWAGVEKNWDYAQYQLEKIALVMECGLERRPRRRASAEDFLRNALPPVKASAEARDSMRFFVSFDSLTAGCNQCHAKEKLPYFAVRRPLTKPSPIGK